MRCSWTIKGLSLLCITFWVFVLVSSTAQPAYAYVDPGTGLFLVQMVGSTFAGMMFLLRKRIRQFLGRFFSRFAEAKGDSVER
jgi:hypothetical protein